jgi:hypothetical protein
MSPRTSTAAVGRGRRDHRDRGAGERFGEEAAKRTRESITRRPVDAAWIQSVAEYGRDIFARKPARSRLYRRRATADHRSSPAVRALRRRARRLLPNALETLQRLAAYETDIILAQVALLEANEAAERAAEQRRVRAQRRRPGRRRQRAIGEAARETRPPPPPPRAACSARPAKSPRRPSSRRWRCARPRRPRPA